LPRVRGVTWEAAGAAAFPDPTFAGASLVERSSIVLAASRVAVSLFSWLLSVDEATRAVAAAMAADVAAATAAASCRISILRARSAADGAIAAKGSCQHRGGQKRRSTRRSGGHGKEGAQAKSVLR